MDDTYFTNNSMEAAIDAERNRKRAKVEEEINKDGFEYVPFVVGDHKCVVIRITFEDGNPLAYATDRPLNSTEKAVVEFIVPIMDKMPELQIRLLGLMTAEKETAKECNELVKEAESDFSDDGYSEFEKVKQLGAATSRIKDKADLIFHAKDLALHSFGFKRIKHHSEINRLSTRDGCLNLSFTEYC